MMALSCPNCGKITATHYYYKGVRVIEVYSDGDNKHRGEFCSFDCLHDHIHKMRGVDNPIPFQSSTPKAVED